MKKTMKRLNNRTAMIIRIEGYTNSMLNSRRLFSSFFYDKNRVLLTSAIDSIYNEEWRVRGVLPFRKDDLLMHLHTEEYYFFEPLDYYEYKRSEIPEFIYQMIDTESRNGYLWLNEWVQDGENMIGVYKCRTEKDLLLLWGLSKVILNTLIVYDTSRNLSKFSDLMHEHYDFLSRQRNVSQLVNIDLGGCMNYIKISDILMRIEFATSGGVVLNLIKQFLNIPIYDWKYNKFLQLGGIPPMGEITDVILHLFYQRVFDPALEARFPGITYTRWGHEVYIVIKENESITFYSNEIDTLLEEINLLVGSNIRYMNRGDLGCLPTSNEERAVVVYEDGEVAVWKFEDI